MAPPTPPPDVTPPTGKPLDTKMLEMLALSVFRAVFGKGIRVPIKISGMVDLDLVVQDANLILDLNEIHLQAPELQIWRVVFAYRGKPVVEYGRGVKNGMRLHLPQLSFLFLALWRERRKNLRAKAQADAARDRELLARTGTEPATGNG
jgi:hypothetical protein